MTTQEEFETAAQRGLSKDAARQQYVALVAELAG